MAVERGPRWAGQFRLRPDAIGDLHLAGRIIRTRFEDGAQQQPCTTTLTGAWPATATLDSAERPLIDDLDDEVIYHRVFDAPHSQWTGNGAAGILAWASEIPPSLASPPPRPRTASSLPKLLRSNRCTAPPALGVTAPPSVIPSPTYPITTTPRQQSTFCSSLSLESLGKQSLLSALSESSLATPASTLPLGVPPTTKPSFFGTLATHVRSWVASSSPLVASSPVASPDLPHISSTVAKQHEPQPKFVLLAQRHIDGPETAWRLQTTILVAEPRSRGRNPSRT
ncbi:hypothetical protein C0989_012444 [Termitomyces sp. Mn162]|nr:hypothetical protein C0989_012444 [Termitomyces sp. Mn162]